MRWSRRLVHLMQDLLDLEHCPHCVGELKIIAANLEASVVRRILTVLGLRGRTPLLSPARGQMLLHAA